ncbi:MAG: TPR protein [uncultured bacterium]|nr:MAG: TPR protein [uncultured bacterium]
MSYTLIPQLIVIASVVVLVVIVLRRLPATKKIQPVGKEEKEKGDQPRKRIFKLRSEKFDKARNLSRKRVQAAAESLGSIFMWAKSRFKRDRKKKREDVVKENVVGAKREIKKKRDVDVFKTLKVEPMFTEKDRTKIRNLVWEARKAVKKREYTRAEKFYVKIISIDPRNLDVYKGLGEVYTKQGNFSDAAKAYKHVVRQGSADEKILLALGEVLIKKKAFSEAMDFLKRVIKLNEKSAPGYALLGQTYRGMRLDKEALKMFETSVGLDSKNVSYLMFLVEAAEKRGLDVIAKMNLNKILELEPENEKAKEKLDRLLAK